MVRELLKYGAQVGPRLALALGAFTVMLGSQVMAQGPAPCAPECAVPEVCAPACEAPAACTPESCVPETCSPGCADTAHAEEEEESWGIMSLFGDGFKDSGIKIGGWTQVGYHSESNGLFNNVPDRLNLHQQWLYIEKVADGSDGLDWGFRADIMYGTDGSKTQAFGNDPGNWDFQNGFDHGVYSWALPQLYAEVAAGDLSVKVGHFYTLIGYEVVTAPDNFFYSHAYTMFNSEPFTHTGAIATYNATDDVTLYAGWTLGWDTGFDQFSGGSNWLGGFSLALTENTTFTYMSTAGDFGSRGNGYSHSLVLDVGLTDDLNYVIQSDYVTNRFDANGNADDRDQYGINQYLFYTISDELSAGVRGEWWRNGDLDVYALTLGVNIKPMDNLVIRPEVRWDWDGPGGQDANNNTLERNFTTFGIDAILTY